MDCRKLNIALKTSMVVLSFVATLVLIKALFSGFNGFEWGSVTDWLSAAGSIGTLIIAIIALMKVPDWMAQKHYDIAYTIVENAVYRDLAEVNSASSQVKIKFSKITRVLGRILRRLENHGKDDVKRLDAIFLEITQNHKEFRRVVYSIINQLKSISRTDYEITSFTQMIIEQLERAAKKYDDIYNQIAWMCSQIEDFYEFSEEIVITIDDIYDIRRELYSNNQKLTVLITNIYDENKPIKHFVSRNKK